MRPPSSLCRKQQVTLSASIVQLAGIEPDDMLMVTFTNGANVISLDATPTPMPTPTPTPKAMESEVQPRG